MLTSSITIAQDGLFLVFDCDRPLRLERIAEIEALGDSNVFARVAVTSDPKTTTTSIFDLGVVGLFIYNDSTEGHLEDWDETTTYADYFQDLSNRVDAQVKRNERIVILETVFDFFHSTTSVTISLIDASDGSGDAILFDGGTYSADIKFNALIEDLPPSTLDPNLLKIIWPALISNVEAEVARIAANTANEVAFNAAYDANTATSNDGRETELEGLSRDGIFVIVTLDSPGYTLEFHDANGLITLTDNDGDPDPQKSLSLTDLDSISDYTSVYNTAVTKVRDLVRDLIIN